MIKYLFRSSAALVLPIVLIACAAQGPLFSYQSDRVVTAEANIFPDQYRSDIVGFLRTYLNDPTRIRSAFISEPVLKAAGSEQRYAVCVRFNARKSNGEYEGSKDRIVFFVAGKLDTLIEAKRDQCGDAAYKPFPEIERLTR